MKILGISGALRAGSMNTKLVKEAARIGGFDAMELADLRLPLYDGDLEDASGRPAEVQRLRDAMSDADGYILSTPEYNGNLPGVLKNALDWVSRGSPRPMEGKPLALMSAAAGKAGGARAQYSARLCLVAFRPLIVPGPEIMIGSAGSAFDENGHLIDERSVTLVSELMDALKTKLG